MTITRNEFKELVHLYQEAWNKSNEMIEYYNEEVVNEMMFPLFDWISEKLGIRINDGEFDLLTDLVVWKHVLIGEEYTDDPDKIYDYYLKKNDAHPREHK